MLRAIILALYDDVGGKMRDPDRRIGLVHMLTARPRSAIGIDPQVLVLNFNFDVIIDNRIHPGAGKAGMAARRTVIGRNTHKTVYAAFRFQPAIGIFAFDPHRHRFDSSLFPGAFLDHLQLEPATLAPAAVHPHQHRRPVLGLGPAGTGVNFQKTVIPVGFA